jgi:hypothetical protein
MPKVRKQRIKEAPQQVERTGKARLQRVKRVSKLLLALMTLMAVVIATAVYKKDLRVDWRRGPQIHLMLGAVQIGEQRVGRWRGVE